MSAQQKPAALASAPGGKSADRVVKKGGTPSTLEFAPQGVKARLPLGAAAAAVAQGAPPPPAKNPHLAVVGPGPTNPVATSATQDSAEKSTATAPGMQNRAELGTASPPISPPQALVWSSPAVCVVRKAPGA